MGNIWELGNFSQPLFLNRAIMVCHGAANIWKQLDMCVAYHGCNLQYMDENDTFLNLVEFLELI